VNDWGEMINEYNSRRVLIVGPPRSGTTWIADVLSQVPNAQLVYEPDNDLGDPFALSAKAGLGRYPVLGAHDVAHDYERLWKAAMTLGLRESSARDWIARGSLQATPVSLIDRIVDGDTRFSTRALRAVFDKMAVPRSRGGPHAEVLIAKSVHSAFALNFITSRWNVSVVIALRNPLNAIASWLELKYRPKRFEANDRVRSEVIDALGLPLPRANDYITGVAYTYLVLMASLRASIAANSGWHLVMHDDLCSDPMAGFEKLLTGLDLPFSDAVEQRISRSNRQGRGYVTNRLASQQADRWRQRLSADQARRISTMARDFDCLPEGYYS
jgi:hypothetical protein